MSNAKTGIRRRPRLSILSLLLLTACVALGIQLGRTHQWAVDMMRWASRLDDENRRLREEYGEFEVADPGLFYAAQINRDETDQSRMLDWKWRVYLPERYVLKLAVGGVSKKGFPPADWQNPLEAGYHTVRLDFQPDLSSQPYSWRADMVTHSRNAEKKINHTRHSHLVVKDPRWPLSLSTAPEQWPIASPHEGVNWGTVTVRDDHSQDPRRPVVLQRLLVQPGPPPAPRSDGHAKWLRSLPPDAKTPGFVIWLEPAP